MAPANPHRFVERGSDVACIDALWAHAPGEAFTVTVPADGCIDLIVCLAGSSCREAFVQEPTVSALQAVIRRDEQLMGVRLRAGFGGPLWAARERVARVARERFRRGGDLAGLEALISDLSDELGSSPALVRDFLALARETRGSARLSGEGGALLSNERRLQRAVRTWLSMTPKTYLRIERVRSARDAIRAGARLVEVAGDLGYADQAHLTREVRALLGVSPRAFLPVGILQDPAVAGR
jgi:hypothetical protein